MTTSPAPEVALAGLGWRPDLPAAKAWQAQPGGRLARVSEQHRSGYRVCDGAREFAVQAPAPWTRRGFAPELRAVVGDFVRLDGRDDHILEWLPRSSLFQRGAAGEHYKLQPIAANIDTVLVVSGLDQDFNLRRLERYLVLVNASGAAPLLVLTKADRCDDVGALRQQLHTIEANGVPVVVINAKDVASVTALAPWLGSGQSVVLVGSSGAGKSTLTNTLLGREKMKAAAVRARDSRGRHTTTHRALSTLPQGGCLIDTPGMRELKLTGMEDVADKVFADIEALARSCRFRDCRHAAEPGCAVRAALAADELEAGRFSSYCKLLAERSQAGADAAAREARGPRRGGSR